MGWDLGSETGDPLERAQPSWGLEGDKGYLFSGCLRLLKHTYSRTLGTLTPTEPHKACQGGVGGGVSNNRYSQP